MATSKFYQEIKEAQIERQVEDVYNKGLLMYFPNTTITYPWNCDGMIATKTDSGKLCKLIIEYKLDELLASKTGRAKVLIQVLFYLKRFEQAGEIIPNVCMVADKNECFVIQTNELLNYMDEEIDWSVSPSIAHTKFPDIVLKIAENENINPFIFKVDENFSFKDVADKIKDLAENITRYVRVTEHNIATIFDYFCTNVIKNQKSISAHDIVSVFMGVITDQENYYQHPTKKNILVTPDKNIDIWGNAFISFFKYFARTYTPQEKMHFSAIADRLIEDTSRRNSGDFWTPTIWVDYAHKMISEQLGEDWKDEYVVYDCCCGSKNLTRDYNFKELYCSTLFDSELKIGEHYNTNAASFQFDFLNDYFPMNGDLMDSIEYHDSKVPQGLIKALKENKKIVFLLNPPYGTACNQGETSKAGINDTIIRKQMRADGLGAGAENLQHQFLYRICKIKESYHLTNCVIALFSNPIFLSGAKQSDFLKYLCNNFEYRNGIMFQASNFADVSGKWGITFNIWKNGKTSDIHNFVHTLVEKNAECELVEIGEKDIYNVWGDKLMSEWVREPIKGKKTKEVVSVSSALIIKEKNVTGFSIDGSMGYFFNQCNNVQVNQQYVSLFSTSYANGHGLSILPQNFFRVTAAFSARKLIQGNWINDKDEYLAPNETHPKYRQFEMDSVIYSLFNTSSNQSSLRNVEYKGKKWDIKNEFFWMSKNDIMELANDNGLDDVYQDARVSNERYVYTMLKDLQLSPIAQKVLDKAIEMTKKSFKYRGLFSEEHPEYQLDKCWDAGYYQLKALWKEYMKEDFDEFKTLYNELYNHLRPQVYELGFLKQ